MDIFYCIANYFFLLLLHTFLVWIIVKHTKEKAPIRIRLIDLINMDLSHIYHYTMIIAGVLFICIEAELFSSSPGVFLTVTICYWFASNIFLQYLSIGIVIRFVQIKQGHMEIFCGLLDGQVRIMFRVITAALSKLSKRVNKRRNFSETCSSLSGIPE